MALRPLLIKVKADQQLWSFFLLFWIYKNKQKKNLTSLKFVRTDFDLKWEKVCEQKKYPCYNCNASDA